MCPRMPEKGGRLAAFTLVEMLIVVAIIGILASLLMPALHNAMNVAYSANCANRLRQLTIAQLSYAADNSEVIALATPDAGNPSIWYGWDYPFFGKNKATYISTGRRNPYLDDIGMITCPQIKSAYESGDGWAYYGGNISASADGLNGYTPAMPPVSYRRIFSRVSRLGSNNALLGDTWRVKSGAARTQWYYFTQADPAAWEGAALHMRHQGRTHLSFVDGHVDAAGMERLAECRIKYFYDLAGNKIPAY